jgi:hypothetical protein
MGSGLYRRGQAMGEGESLWSRLSVITPDGTGQHAWLVEELEVTEVFFKQRNKQGNNQGSLVIGHKSRGLVSVLASGPSACPKNAKDLTVL